MKKIIISICLSNRCNCINWLGINKKQEGNEAKTAVVAEGARGDVSVRTATIAKEVVDMDFSVNGNFQANQRITFNAENSGRITRIYAEEGTRVSKGQLIASIETNI